MELSETLNEGLNRLLAFGGVKVQENGSWLASLENFQYEVREKAGATLLHLWSAEATLVRRVIGIDVHEDGRLVLRVTRFGRARENQLEFVCRERDLERGELRRAQFRSTLGEMLARQFPDETVNSLTSAPDLEHSLSGNYVRGITTAPKRATAVIAAAEGESSATYDALLTFGLLWLDRARHRKLPQPIGGLRLFFPQGCGAVIAHRLRAVCSSIEVELYEYEPATRRMGRVDPRDSGNVKSWLVPRREFERALADARAAIAPILRIDPAAITAEVIPGTSEVALRFRGLRFARWEQRGVFFGIDSEQELTPATRPELERLLRKLEAHRSPLAVSRQHRFIAHKRSAGWNLWSSRMPHASMPGLTRVFFMLRCRRSQPEIGASWTFWGLRARVASPSWNSKPAKTCSS